jgi:hypothetical protein
MASCEVPLRGLASVAHLLLLGEAPLLNLEVRGRA